MGNSADYASAGATALQRGDAQKAREMFAQAAAGDVAAALDRLLAADPRNTLALIRRADCFAEAGDTRSASAFYLQTPCVPSLATTVPTPPSPEERS